MRRQSRFIMNRLQVGTENRARDDLKEIRDFMHLIKAPHAKNPELERIHDIASKRLSELDLAKQQRTIERQTPWRIGKRPDTVVIDEDDDDEEEKASNELMAEAN